MNLCTCKWRPGEAIPVRDPRGVVYCPKCQKPFAAVSESILQSAHAFVHGPRQADYGHPMEDFTRTAALWSTLLGVQVLPEQVGLCMIALKLSREWHKHTDDSLIDIAGYAETVHLIHASRRH